jgi:hypothetical protein
MFDVDAQICPLTRQTGREPTLPMAVMKRKKCRGAARALRPASGARIEDL